MYGYNLRVSDGGKLPIRFNTTPAVTFTGTDELENVQTGDNNAYLDIVVTAKRAVAGGGASRRRWRLATEPLGLARDVARATQAENRPGKGWQTFPGR